jgi:ribosomal protein L11 methyltransferase
MADAYWELEAELEPAAEELWGLFCLERGALGCELLDEDGARCVVRHYFAADALQEPPEPDTWQAEFRAAYPGVAPPRRLTARPLAAQAWELAWRVHFTPLRLGRRLLIVPPWVPAPPDTKPGDAELDDAGRVRIVIDPGQGFGTGWHASTALALLMLEDLLGASPPPPVPSRLLDVGTGSGILAIAGRLLGVPQAVTLDLDAQALPDVRRNFALSGLAAPLGMLRGGPECLRGAFPLVLANIVSEVLLAHRAALAGLTALGGCLILSGILEPERAALVEAYAALGFAPIHERRREGWVALCLRRA